MDFKISTPVPLIDSTPMNKALDVGLSWDAVTSADVQNYISRELATRSHKLDQMLCRVSRSVARPELWRLFLHRTKTPSSLNNIDAARIISSPQPHYHEWEADWTMGWIDG